MNTERSATTLVKRGLKKAVRFLLSIRLIRQISAGLTRASWFFFKVTYGRKSPQRFTIPLASWKPAGGSPVVAMRWMMTHLCPYSCSYCLVNRDILEKKSKGNHAFHNYSVAEWLSAFRRHFVLDRLSLTITGGEPMADRNSVIALLNGLSSMSTVECIRIDTNAFWEPEQYCELDRSKLTLNCAFHPGQTDEEAYFDRMRRIVSSGFRVAKVNYVFFGNQMDRYLEYKARLGKLGIPINANSEVHSSRTEEEQKFLAQELTEFEFKHKVMRSPTFGKQCLYPSIAYQMDYAGKVSVGCFPLVSGSFFDDRLPKRPEGPVPCPSRNCYCTDKHVMLEDADPLRAAAINPLAFYREELLNLHGQGNIDG